MAMFLPLIVVNCFKLRSAPLGASPLPVSPQRQKRFPRPPALKGNIRHSIVSWCFEPHWSLDEMCEDARQLGCKSVELGRPATWPTLKKYGLTCAASRRAISSFKA